MKRRFVSPASVLVASLLPSLALPTMSGAQQPSTHYTGTASNNTGSKPNDLEVNFTGTGGQINNPMLSNPPGTIGVNPTNASEIIIQFNDPLAANGAVDFTFDSPQSRVAVYSSMWTFQANNVKLSSQSIPSGSLVTVVADNNTNIPIDDLETTFTSLGGAITNPTLIAPVSGATIQVNPTNGSEVNVNFATPLPVNGTVEYTFQAPGSSVGLDIAQWSKDANNVIISSVPEPSSIIMMGIAMAALLSYYWAMRRGRSKGAETGTQLVPEHAC